MKERQYHEQREKQKGAEAIDDKTESRGAEGAAVVSFLEDDTLARASVVV